jgi:hypothetical protein
MVAERRRGPTSDAFVLVRLTRKYAETIDGVDLSHTKVGDYLRLSSREASLLLSEGWAVACAEPADASFGLISSARRQTQSEVAVTASGRAVGAEKPRLMGFATAASNIDLSEQDRPLYRWFHGPPAQIVV